MGNMNDRGTPSGRGSRHNISILDSFWSFIRSRLGRLNAASVPMVDKSVTNPLYPGYGVTGTQNVASVGNPLGRENEPSYAGDRITGTENVGSVGNTLGRENEPSYAGDRITGTFQIYCGQDIADKKLVVLEKLKQQLGQEMSSRQLKIQINICSSKEEVIDNNPLILVCLNTSRLKSELENASNGIKVGRYTLILILHIVDAHALPKMSTKTTLTETKYNEAKDIIDMAFTSYKGFYACSMNRTAWDEMAMFFRSFVPGKHL